MGKIVAGKTVVAGAAQGTALVSSEPLSFWGGYDQTSGEIIDRRHPLSGENAAGKILVLPFTRGSSTTTAVLLESIRAGYAPAGIITTAADHFLALASIVAEELYGKPLPIVAVTLDDLAHFRSGQTISIRESGDITLE